MFPGGGPVAEGTVVKLVDFIAGIEATAFRSWAHAAPWALTGALEGFLEELIGGLSDEYAVSHGIAVHRSARIEAGAIVKPPAVLSAASFVAANAYVRGGAFIGESCIVGPGVELKTSVLFACSKIAHLSFVGDSVIGERANCEAGAMIANYRNERPRPIEAPWDDLPGVVLAPGALDAFTALTARGVRTAIVSITWSFAVEAFARRLGANAWVGTGVTDTGCIDHFWPEDKPVWLRGHAAALGIALTDVAAVGDSTSDVPMLAAVGYPVFVGRDRPPAIAHAEHAPDGNLREVVERLLHVGS
jgi:phosphoserine phosphatase